MSYKIECIIQELTWNASGNFGIKIRGAEGYQLKLQDKEYNVFCPDKMPEKIGGAAIVCADAILKFAAETEREFQILAQAKCAGKKIQLKVEKIAEDGNGISVNVQSISIL